MSKDAPTEIKPEEMQQIHREFANLAMWLDAGVKPLDNIKSPDQVTPDSKLYYTHDDVQKVRTKLGTVLASMQPPPPRVPISEAEAQELLIEKLAVGNSAYYSDISNAVKSAESNMTALNANATDIETREAARLAALPAAQQPQASTAPVTHAAGYDARIEHLEKALLDIAPVLNGLTKKYKIDISFDGTIETPGKVDGFLDAQSLESYQDTMQHLNFLSQVERNRATAGVSTVANLLGFKLDGISKDQPRRFIDKPEDVESIRELLTKELTESIAEKNDERIKILKSGTNDAKANELQAQIDKLTNLKDVVVPKVLTDLASLTKEGKLLNAVEPPKIAEVVTPTTPTAKPETETTAQPVKKEVKPITAEQRKEMLRKADELKTETEQELKTDIKTHIATAKGLLFVLSQKIDELDSIGITGAVVTPLTGDDLKGNDFGENFQDILAKAIVLVRTIDGEENPNGVYSPAVGNKLRKAILTNDALQPIRDALEIPQMSAEVAAKYFKNTVGLSDAEIVDHEKTKRRIDIQLGLVNKDKPEDVNQLDGFITALNAMHDHNGKNLLDPHKKAKDITTMNIMLDGIAASMEKWAPGMIGHLKEFFTNSEFGKMIGGLLTLFGMNPGRLWGEKDDTAALDRAKPAIEDGFGFFYGIAEKDLKDQGANSDVADVVGKMKADMHEKLNGSGEGFTGYLKKKAFDGAMNALFKGQGKEFIGGVLDKALDEAAKAGSLESAKEAFADYIAEAGKVYKQDRNITVEQLSERIAEAEKTVQAAAKEEPKFAPPPATKEPAKSSSPANTTADNAKIIIAGKYKEWYATHNGNADLIVNEIEAFYDEAAELLEKNSNFSEKDRQDLKEIVTKANGDPDLFISLLSNGEDIVETNPAVIIAEKYKEWHTMHNGDVDLIINEIETFHSEASELLREENAGLSEEGREHLRDILTKANGDPDLFVSLAMKATTAKADNANIIMAGNIEIALAFDLNKTGFEQDPLRYSHGRVGEMQEVLGNTQNHEKLGLTIPIEKLRQSDGRFTDTATRHTSAIFEELVIRAKIHDLVKKYDATPDKDDHITKADIARINASDNKLSKDNFDIVETLMRDVKISDADVDQFFLSANELAGDYYSTSPTDKTAGEKQDISVLEQAFYGEQFKLGINMPAPKVEEELKTIIFPPHEPIVGLEQKIERAVVADPPKKVERAVVADPPKPEPITQNFNKLCGARPETFKDLDTLSTFTKKLLASKGLDVEALFEGALGSIQNGESQFVILDLERHNLTGASYPDVLVAMRHGDRIDIRRIDYSCGDFKTLADQKRDGFADMGQRHSAPSGIFRIDDFLDERQRFPGGVIKQGSVGGYPRMLYVGVNSEGDPIVQTAMRGVYGDVGATVAAVTAYSAGYSFRHPARTSFENVTKARAEGADPHGLTDSIILNAGQQPTQEPYKSKAGGHFIVDIFNSWKASINGDDEKPDNNKAVEQNMNDMGMEEGAPVTSVGGAPVYESIPTHNNPSSVGSRI